MKIKSFKQFLNEFEIEGEHYQGNRYNGSEKEIFHQFIEELANKVHSRGDYDLVEENPGEYSVYEMEGYDISPIGCNLSLSNNILYITVSMQSKEINKLKDILKILELDKFIVGEDDDIQFHHIMLQIPVN